MSKYTALEQVLDYHIDRASTKEDYEVDVEANTELAQLRSAAARCAELEAVVDAQAAQLKQARELIGICHDREEAGNTQNPYMIKRLRAWLAAHAPAPEAEYTA